MASRTTPNILRHLLRKTTTTPLLHHQTPRTAQPTTYRLFSQRTLSCAQFQCSSQLKSFFLRSPCSQLVATTATRSFASTSSTPNNSSAPPSSPEAAAAIETAIEQIQDLYGSARDEFEMAAEETEKNTTYAADDRAAAREELDKLLEFYGGIVEGGDAAVAEEVKRRVGAKVRELEQAMIALEESVIHGD